MDYFLAKSDRQLGICIRMLNDEGFTELIVRSEKNTNNRMEFHVFITTDEERFARLLERYKTMIS